MIFALLEKGNFRTGAFLGSFVGIYKVSFILITRSLFIVKLSFSLFLWIWTDNGIILALVMWAVFILYRQTLLAVIVFTKTKLTLIYRFLLGLIYKNLSVLTLLKFITHLSLPQLPSSTHVRFRKSQSLIHESLED